MRNIKNYINGSFVESTNMIDKINPHTEKIMSKFPDSNVKDVE